MSRRKQLAGVILVVAGAALAASLAGCRAKAPRGKSQGKAEGVEPSRGTAGQAASPATPAGKAVAVTDANFKTVTAKGVVLVDLWAPWCPPCRRQGPIVEAVAKLYAGRAVVGKLNVDENAATAKALNVKAIPTLIVFKDGREVKRLVGLSSEAKLKAALDAVIGAD